MSNMEAFNKIMSEIGKQLTEETITDIKAALEAKDAPVAWRYDQAKYRTNDLRGRQWAFNVFSQAMPYMDEMVQNVTPLYTTPPQRTWVGLTYEDMVALQKDLYNAKGESVLPTTFAMAVEAKLKEKNHA